MSRVGCAIVSPPNVISACQCQATNHSTRRHARMCRIGQVTAFGTRRSVTASTHRQRQPTANTSGDALT
ncbi:hypothetical protein SVAN01_11277 [Stagonosporopsis vannaccii]|nr:hypothetical protein SVAN01_11277 [Stagonosporopsis vannaccii]